MQPFSPLLRGGDMSVIRVDPALPSADHRATVTRRAAPEAALADARTTVVAGQRRGALLPSRAQARS
jgi:hypothetical protein